jgi:opacity protein-like surface antigen
MKNYRTYLCMLMGAALLSLCATAAVAQDVESPMRETQWGMTRDEVLTIEVASGSAAPTVSDNTLQYQSTLHDWPIDVVYRFDGDVGLVAIEIHLQPMDSLRAYRTYRKVGLMLASLYGRATYGSQTNESLRSGLQRYWWRNMDTDVMLAGTGGTGSSGSDVQNNFVVTVECRSRQFAESLPCIRIGEF